MSYLVFALQGLGDALEATPIITGIRNFDQNARIEVAVTRGGPARLFRQLPHLVSRVIELPYWESGAAGFAAKLGRQMWQRSYDASFMAYPAAKPAYHFVNALFRSRRRFCHLYSEPRVANGLRFYTDLVPIRGVHNVERNLDLLEAAGIQPPPEIAYSIPPQWLVNSGRDPAQITMHIGTISHDGFENKRWPLAKFATVARQLTASGYTVWLLAGPDEYAETRELQTNVPGSRIFSGSLDETARHLSQSALVLTNDSGIGHLASALRRPVISLFGPTPTTGAPYGVSSYPIRTSPCPPCFHPLSRGISCALDIDYKCLKIDLTTADVLAKIHMVLDRNRVDA